MATFSGISTALSSLQAQRVAMDVAGQNIANVRHPGYSRQRVNMTAGAIGVDVSSIERLHSGILGDRARTEGARLGDLTVTSAVLNEIEQVLPEPSTSGLQAKLDALLDGIRGYRERHKQCSGANTSNRASQRAHRHTQ